MKRSTSSVLISFLLPLSLLLISASAQTPKPKCHPDDQIAIEKIAAFFGHKFTGDCCDYPLAVICTYFPPYNRVTLFSADSTNNVSGHIPAAIADLSYLDSLQFAGTTNIIGTIPPAFAKLTKLTRLAFTQTGISGPIPTIHLPSLTYIFLENNPALTGPIPSDLPSMFPKLTGLQLQNNKFTGTIPESLGNFAWSESDFALLNLANNSLTGTIPKTLANTDPFKIDLSGNNFIGDASPLFGANKTTEILYLHANKFSFDLSKVQFSTEFREISISYNKIFGSLPQQMTELLSLKKLDVSHNLLCGEIPQGGLLQKFKVSRYANNKCLCGAPLSPCVKANHTKGV